MTMEAISYTSFREKLAQKLKEVCDNHLGIIVTRRNADPVVVISLEDYRAMEETLYLLKSPKNARELMEAIEEVEKGDLVEMELCEDYED